TQCAASEVVAGRHGRVGTPGREPLAANQRTRPRDSRVVRPQSNQSVSAPGCLKAPLILIGIYCGLGGCDFLASALLFITGGVPLPCDPVDLPFLAKVACGRLAFYSTALKL